jgi:N-glycosylase/DNA lyase
VYFYLVTIEDDPIELSRIANCGQMFRWKEIVGGWQANDGEHRYDIVQIGETLFEVSSNQPEEAFRSLFRLEQDHRNLKKELVTRGPEIEPFLSNRKGLRMMRANSKTEVLFSFLCSSCNHVNRITSMVWSLANRSEGGFPSISQLSEVTEAELRTDGFGYRGATIPRVAQILNAQGGEQYLDDLSKGTYRNARKELINLPGVGKKLADCICLYAFDFGESVPVDTHIWQVLTRLYHPEWVGASLTDTKYESVSNHFRDRFGEFAGAAHQFLFVDNMERYRERE